KLLQKCHSCRMLLLHRFQNDNAVLICLRSRYARLVIAYAAQQSPWGPTTALGVFLCHSKGDQHRACRPHCGWFVRCRARPPPTLAGSSPTKPRSGARWSGRPTDRPLRPYRLILEGKGLIIRQFASNAGKNIVGNRRGGRSATTT